MSVVDETACVGGARCVCLTHTAERIAKASGPPKATPIVELLDAEQTSRYYSLAVDSFALQNRVLREENGQLREHQALLNRSVRSMERRVEQVLLHRWRSRIWSALVATVVVLAIDGTLAGWFA